MGGGGGGHFARVVPSSNRRGGGARTSKSLTLHPPRWAAHSSYAIKAPAARTAIRAARPSLRGPWAICMPRWARPRGPIADPLLYLGPCRPHLPSSRYSADFPPIFRRFSAMLRRAPRYAVYDNSRVSLLHASGGGGGGGGGQRAPGYHRH